MLNSSALLKKKPGILYAKGRTGILTAITTHTVSL